MRQIGCPESNVEMHGLAVIRCIRTRGCGRSKIRLNKPCDTACPKTSRHQGITIETGCIYAPRKVVRVQHHLSEPATTRVWRIPRFLDLSTRAQQHAGIRHLLRVEQCDPRDCEIHQMNPGHCWVPRRWEVSRCLRQLHRTSSHVELRDDNRTSLLDH